MYTASIYLASSYCSTCVRMLLQPAVRMTWTYAAYADVYSRMLTYADVC